MDQAVFLDKDGTLIEDVPYNVDPARIRLKPGTLEGLVLLREAGYRIVVVTNQSGVALGRFSEEALRGVEARVRELLSEAEIPLEGFYYCPHHPRGVVREYTWVCGCRKPKPGLILRAAEELGIDRASSWFVGDILDDVEAGHRAGCRAVLVDHGAETQWRLNPLRIPDGLAMDLLDAAQQILSAGPSSGLARAGRLHPGGFR